MRAVPKTMAYTTSTNLPRALKSQTGYESFDASDYGRSSGLWFLIRSKDESA
jgi:hypothetical protein